MMGVYIHVFWDDKSIASNKKWLRSKQVPLLATFSHSLSHRQAKNSNILYRKCNMSYWVSILISY